MHSMHNCTLCKISVEFNFVKSIIIYDKQTALLFAIAPKLLVTAVHVQAIKAFRGSRGIAPPILNLGSK